MPYENNKAGGGPDPGKREAKAHRVFSEVLSHFFLLPADRLETYQDALSRIKYRGSWCVLVVFKPLSWRALLIMRPTRHLRLRPNRQIQGRESRLRVSTIAVIPPVLQLTGGYDWP